MGSRFCNKPSGSKSLEGSSALRDQASVRPSLGQRRTHQQPASSGAELIYKLLLSLAYLQAVLCRDRCPQDPDPFRAPTYPAFEANANKKEHWPQTFLSSCSSKGTSMKKLINDPRNVVREMLEGLVDIEPGLALLEGETIVLRSDRSINSARLR